MDQAAIVEEKKVDQKEEKKKAKWKAFCEKYADRIKTMPNLGGKIKVPCVWNDKTEEWIWVDRAMRRQSMRKAGKIK